ncbi:ATP-binding protein [Natrialbaceae archaeon A-CW3]
MAKSMERFTVSNDGFALPVTDVLTGRGFVTGKSGSGKSNSASVVAEELLDRELGLLIIDTDGEYYGLKEAYDLIHFGGDDSCDVQIDVEDAPQVAEVALEDNVPVILDVSAYMDEDESREILYEAIKTLFVEEKKHQKPFLLLVEEAHEFIPERGASDDLSEMLIRVAKRGRKRGLGILGMSQRPAAVSKDYITQCDWIVWHRLTWDNDTAVVDRILGEEAAETVQTLNDGEAIVLSDWDESVQRVQFRRKRTADAGSTPTLERARGSSAERSELIRRLGGEVDHEGHRDTETVDSEETPDTETEDSSDAEAELPAQHTYDDGDATPVATEQTDRRNPHRVASHPPRRETTTRDRRLGRNDPEEYDPVWEVGDMVIHLYEGIRKRHRRLVRGVESALVTRFGPTTYVEPTRQGVSPFRSARFFSTIASVLVVSFYLAVILLLVALVS